MKIEIDDVMCCLGVLRSTSTAEYRGSRVVLQLTHNKRQTLQENALQLIQNIYAQIRFVLRKSLI
jgi:hypothetical protein